ncbi:MAG: low molecular weight phosphotyrosine protein phosphatase, partial [Chloroflexota bacterium]
DDLNDFDYIIVMDQSNHADVLSLTRGRSMAGEIALLLTFADDTTLTDVPDPYYTGNFEYVYQLVYSSCQGLLAHIRKAHNI